MAGLTVLGKVSNQQVMLATYEQVIHLMSHPHELVRKKSVMVLIRFYGLYPQGLD